MDAKAAPVRKANEAGTLSTSPRRSTRKRKQISHSSIRVGSTREVPFPTVRNQPEESESSRKEKDQNAAVAAAAASAVAAAASTFSAIVPVVSQDQATLERLSAENGTGPKLSAFCSQFKTKKVKSNRRGSKRRKTNHIDENEVTNEASNTDAVGASPTNEASVKIDDGDFSTSQQAPVGVPVVQIIDGEIVLQESSLILPTRRTVQEVEEEFQDNVVEEDSQLAIIQATYTSFLTKGDAAANGGKLSRPQHWSLQETQQFYAALRQLGTDFGLMEMLFDGKRTRRQLKQKYRIEGAKNPNLVQELALNPKYKADLGKSGVFDFWSVFCVAKFEVVHHFDFIAQMRRHSTLTSTQGELQSTKTKIPHPTSPLMSRRIGQPRISGSCKRSSGMWMIAT
jgi:hypothetical protein